MKSSLTDWSNSTQHVTSKEDLGNRIYLALSALATAPSWKSAFLPVPLAEDADGYILAVLLEYDTTDHKVTYRYAAFDNTSGADESKLENWIIYFYDVFQLSVGIITMAGQVEDIVAYDLSQYLPFN